jgi:hypothetical protein
MQIPERNKDAFTLVSCRKLSLWLTNFEKNTRMETMEINATYSM